RRDTFRRPQASTTLRVAVVSASPHSIEPFGGKAFDASTTASTPASASTRPSPVTRSTPLARDTATTSTFSSFRRRTTREPAVPVAPRTAIFMSSPFLSVPLRTGRSRSHGRPPTRPTSGTPPDKPGHYTSRFIDAGGQRTTHLGFRAREGKQPGNPQHNERPAAEPGRSTGGNQRRINS